MISPDNLDFAFCLRNGVLVLTKTVDITFNERTLIADRCDNGLREPVLLPPGPSREIVCGDSELAELLSLFRFLASWDSDTECHANTNQGWSQNSEC